MLLIPQLEDWVLHHTKRGTKFDPESDAESDAKSSTESDTESVASLDNIVTIPFEMGRTTGWMSFKTGSMEMGGFIQNIHICSIAGVVTKEEVEQHNQSAKASTKSGDSDESDVDSDESDDEDKDDYNDYEFDDDEDDDRPYFCDPDFLLVREIANSAPDSWFMFRLPVFNKPATWVFVNYKDQKMFLGNDPSTEHCWNDMCDLSSWERIPESIDLEDEISSGEDDEDW